MKRGKYMNYNKPKMKKQYNPRTDHGTTAASDNYKINLADVIANTKEKVKIGTGIIFKDADCIGNVIDLFDNHVLCRSITDNYNFSVSWINIALGYAEVI